MNVLKGLSEKKKEELLSMSLVEVYQKGFEDGKMAVESVKHLQDVTFKSPNQQRAELIQRAREFVEERGAIRYGNEDNQDKTQGNYTARHHWYETDFFIKDMKVTAVVYWLAGGTDRVKGSRHVGRANCASGDVFNADIGKAIALARALKIDIPQEFLQAVQPNEVVAGMIVGDIDELEGATALFDDFTVSRVEDDECWDQNSETFARRRDVYILDDTNAIYEEVPK